MSLWAEGITFLNKILRGIGKHGQMVKLGNAQPRVVVQLYHQALHLLILHMH